MWTNVRVCVISAYLNMCALIINTVFLNNTSHLMRYERPLVSAFVLQMYTHHAGKGTWLLSSNLSPVFNPYNNQ